MSDINFKDQTNWDEIDPTYTTVRGFHPQKQFFKRLEELVPDMKFGGCTQEEFPNWISEHWQPLTIANFSCKTVDEFNSRVSLRLDLRYDRATGLLWHRSNIIMYIKKSLYIRKRELENELSLEEFNRSNIQPEVRKITRADRSLEDAPLQITKNLRKGNIDDLDKSE